MKRKYPFAVGSIYHIYNRGVAKCSIYAEEGDYWRFLQGLCLFNDVKSTNRVLWELERQRGELNLRVLRDYVVNPEHEREKLVRILAYCIIDNHYHLLVEEIREGGVTQFMHKLGTGYAAFFNKKHERVGPLFQGRFKNVLVDKDLYLQYLLVYINVLNPANFVAPNWKEEGIGNVEKVLRYAEEYPWSSHLDYLGFRNSIIIEKGIFEHMFPVPKAYPDFVAAVLAGKKHEAISHLTLEDV
ncbi:transposase [Patescibacteria group bacterium]|nr:transposase [Patescibacteria group bacterium]